MVDDVYKILRFRDCYYVKRCKTRRKMLREKRLNDNYCNFGKCLVLLCKRTMTVVSRQSMRKRHDLIWTMEEVPVVTNLGKFLTLHLVL